MDKKSNAHTKAILRLLYSLLLMLLVAQRISPLAYEQTKTNKLMITGLKSLFSFEVMPHSDSKPRCTNTFVNEITAEIEMSKIPPSLRLRWSVLCNISSNITHIQHKNSLDALFLGWELASQGDFANAIIIWQSYPPLANYFVNISSQMFKEKQIAMSLRYLNIAKDINPTIEQDNYLYNWVGCGYYTDMDEWKSALPFCEQAVTMRDFNRDWHTLGSVYYQLGRYEDAIITYKQADTPLARHRQAIIYKSLGEFNEAERVLLENIKYNPDFEQSYQILYKLYLDQNQTCNAYTLLAERYMENCLQDNIDAPQIFCEFLEDTSRSECK